MENRVEIIRNMVNEMDKKFENYKFVIDQIATGIMSGCNVLLYGNDDHMIHKITTFVANAISKSNYTILTPEGTGKSELIKSSYTKTNTFGKPHTIILRDITKFSPSELYDIELLDFDDLHINRVVLVKDNMKQLIATTTTDTLDEVNNPIFRRFPIKVCVDYDVHDTKHYTDYLLSKLDKHITTHEMDVFKTSLDRCGFDITDTQLDSIAAIAKARMELDPDTEMIDSVDLDYALYEAGISFNYPTEEEL